MLAVAKTAEVGTQCMKGLGIAKGKLKDALDLFALDEVYTKITEGHLILVKIGLGENDDVIQQAAKIGEWGKEAQNELVSRFVGAVMMRFGRRQMLDHDRNEFGYKCFRCARELFKGLGNAYGTFHALFSEIYALMVVHDHATARNTIEDADEVLRKLIISLDDRASTATSQIDRDQISGMKESALNSYTPLVASVMHACGDMKGLDEWRKEFRPPTIRSHLSMMAGGLIDLASYLSLGRRANLKGSEIPDELGAILTISDQFSNCQAKYSQALQAMDLPRAEQHLAEFLQQVDFSIPEAVTFGITAAFMIGDSNKAKDLLDKIDEDYMYANTLFFRTSRQAIPKGRSM